MDLSKVSRNSLKIPSLDVRGIPYEIKNSKASNRLAINVKNGGLVVIHKAKMVPMSYVNDFVERKIDWITEKYLKAYVPKRQFTENEDYLYLGKHYRIHKVNAKSNKVFIENDLLVVYTNCLEIEKIQKLVNRFLKKQAEEVFNMCLMRCFEQMKPYLKEYPNLLIKQYKSRWGTCHPAKKTIMLNIALIHVPVHLIEYVVYHELAHFVYLDHQPHFHQFLQKFVKNEKQLKKELNLYQTVYH